MDSEQNLQTKWWHPFTPMMRDMSNWMGKKRKLTFIQMLESLESSYIPQVNLVQHGGQIKSLWDRNNGRWGCRAQHSTLSVECVQSQGQKKLCLQGGLMEVTTTKRVMHATCKTRCFTHDGNKTEQMGQHTVTEQKNKTCHACHLQSGLLYTRQKQNVTGAVYSHSAGK